jgi:hypothetical protein
MGGKMFTQPDLRINRLLLKGLLLLFLMSILFSRPVVALGNRTGNSGTGPGVYENGTITIDGTTLPLIEPEASPLNRATNVSAPGAGPAPDGDGILSIEPVGDHAVGDLVLIHGTASLPAATELNIRIYRGSYSPGIPPQADPWYDHIPTTVRVNYNNKTVNVWSCEVNTTGSYPDEYLVLVECPRDSTVNATAFFHLVPAHATATGIATNAYVITIDPITTPVRNGSFTIAGTTDLPPGDELLVEVYSPNRTLGPRGTDYSGAVGVVKVREGVQVKNTWSFEVNSSDLKPDDYQVTVNSYRYGTGNDTYFSVLPEENNNPAASPTRPASLPVMIPAAAGGFCAVAVLFRKK